MKDWREYPEDTKFSEMVFDCWKCSSSTTSKLIYWKAVLCVAPFCDECIDTEKKRFYKGSALAPHGIDAIVKFGKFKSLRSMKRRRS